jgi:serine protease Do
MRRALTVALVTLPLGLGLGLGWRLGGALDQPTLAAPLPGGLGPDFAGVARRATPAVISATGRANVGIVDYEDFLQTDAAINPGNSGGALVNTRAELIGINSAIYSETGGYQGIGFAVPSNLARRVVEQIAAHGRVRRGFVGITQIRELDERTAAVLGLKTQQGAVIVELLRRSPADRAGLEPGDIVLAVGSVTIEDAPHLRNALAAAEAGSQIELTILREGRRRQVRVAVEETPGQGSWEKQ